MLIEHQVYTLSYKHCLWYPCYRCQFIKSFCCYFIDENSFEYLVRAIELLAESAWRLLPFYHFDEDSGVWRYQNMNIGVATVLADIDFLNLGACPAPTQYSLPLSECLALAEHSLNTHCH